MSKKEYRIKPNKHVVNGVAFDSTLELNYSRLFDELGFYWEREPIEFPNWRPDFLVNACGQSYLVEVKPAMSFFDVSKVELALKRGATVVLLPSNPMSAITFCWKGNLKSFRDCLPENIHDIWQEVQS